MEGVVLGIRLLAEFREEEMGWRGGDWGAYTFLPITPRQAIDGIVAMMWN